MGIEHVAIVGMVLMACLLIYVLRITERIIREARQSQDEALLMAKSESLDQFAAAADRLRTQRLEDARGWAQRGKVERPGGEAPVARRAPGAFQQVWRRAPRPVTEEPKE